ncbi:uncharacterized protein FTOL_08207 [Fusarium torulosum]|uniref:CCHC-type domain-containing protein n=1 Tax=Fusarium torulosum TaxID=33205 RepID=A0AAE8MEV8_9HYPO|nr:uncharacterized protein FTOL_08207 [Fusarium torulosum]
MSSSPESPVAQASMDQIVFDPNFSASLISFFNVALRPLIDEVRHLRGERSELEGCAPLVQILNSQIQALQQTIQEYLSPGPEKVYEPERHVMKIVIGDDIEAIQARSRQTLLQYVRNIKPEYQDVISVEFVNLESLYDAFGFTHATRTMRDTYLLEIRDYNPWGRTQGITGGDQPDERAEMDLLVRQNFPELSRGRVLRAKVSFKRVLLETSDLGDALKLDGSEKTIYGQLYTLRAIGPQGTPLFCYNCGKPAHFKYQCTAYQRCSRCSGEHDTRECPVRDRAHFSCPNCGGPHAAWDTACTDRNSHYLTPPTLFDDRFFEGKASLPPSSFHIIIENKSFPTLEEALDYHYEVTHCEGPIREISAERAMAVDPELKQAEGLPPRPVRLFFSLARHTTPDSLSLIETFHVKHGPEVIVDTGFWGWR